LDFGLWTLESLAVFPLLFSLLALAGCGVQGEPLPPLLNLPQPAEISAVQRGDKALIDWALPALTTEGQAVRADKLGPVEVYRAIIPGLRREVGRGEFESAAQRIAELPVRESHYAAELKPEGPPHTAAFAIRLLNDRGHNAGFSNVVAIAVVPPPAAPAWLRATATEEAILLEWPPAPGAASYHVYRSEQTPRPEQGAQAPPPLLLLGNADKAGYADPNFEFGQEYRYLVRAVATRDGFSGESADSPPAVVRPQDVFPPGVPSGLVGLVTEPTAPGQPLAVELSWEPSSAHDLAGYNVFRSDAGAPPRRLNPGLLLAPAFRDAAVQPGVSYSYSVSAVDQKGNQSARCEPVRVRP
jgi:hypothetical protein